jgi:hypothetical protein
MWLRILLVGIGLGAPLCACALVDPVDNRYDTVARSLAKARNETIFLNLVRASHDYPLSFVIISNVTPSMQNTTSLALPTFLLGPHIPSFGNPGTNVASPLFTPGRDVIFGNTTASNSTQVSTNFNVSTQETSTFYQGFLKPIDLQTLNYFIRQGYPRELLFWLFTDSFQLELDGKKYGYRYDPPDDYGCSREDDKHRCFIDWVHTATLAGLTVEEKTLQTSASSSGGGGGSGSPSTPGKTSTTAFARFCLDRILGQQAQATLSKEEVALQTSTSGRLPNLDFPLKGLYLPALKLNCREDWDTTSMLGAQTDVLPLKFCPGQDDNSDNKQPTKCKSTFTIVPRSAYGVFKFLGMLMKIEREHIAPAPYAFIPLGREYALGPPQLETVHEDPPLMTVLQNLGGECFVHTWFVDGEYCVPEQAATTKRVFGLLAQLIAIQTAANDLSITPIVRVIQ